MSKQKSKSQFYDIKTRKFLPKEIFEHIGKETHIFENEIVKMTSLRYQLFSTKGCTCVNCGKEGTHFKLEQKGSQRYHFNLYSDDGILFTKDHIIPKSCGGTNNLNNFQTMCAKCNESKSNSYTKEDVLNGEIKKGFKINPNGKQQSDSFSVSERKRVGLSKNEVKILRNSVLEERILINEYMKEHHINCYENKEIMPENIKIAMENVINTYSKIIESYRGNISASAKELHGLPQSETIVIIQKVKDQLL